MPSISKRTGTCFMCGKPAKFGVFGRYYCEEHYNSLPKSTNKSSGGLIALPEKELKETLTDPQAYYDRPFFKMVPKGNKVFASLFLSHYPESKGIVGRSINYLILYKGKIQGIIGINNPPYAVKPVDEFFWINKENRHDMNAKIANNHIFRIITEEKNLASQCLKTLRIVAIKDWKEKYGDELIGLITFVEPPRTGTCYLADNWKFLGMTKGYGTTQRSKRWENRVWVRKEPKLIFGIKLGKVNYRKSPEPEMSYFR